MNKELDTRYHGLDALRGIAMMLGIVLHAALPYVGKDYGTFWPQDSDSSVAISTINANPLSVYEQTIQLYLHLKMKYLLPIHVHLYA